jgi:hypothetical protein
MGAFSNLYDLADFLQILHTINWRHNYVRIFLKGDGGRRDIVQSVKLKI